MKTHIKNQSTFIKHPSKIEQKTIPKTIKILTHAVGFWTTFWLIWGAQVGAQIDQKSKKK